MLNLLKLKFVAFDILVKKNYLSLIFDTKIHFDMMNIGETIKEENQTSLWSHTTTNINDIFVYLNLRMPFYRVTKLY